MDKVDLNKCQSIKSKKDIYHQCPKCKKGNHKFCGIHLRLNKRQLYSDIYNNFTCSKKICSVKEDMEYNVDTLFENINNDANMKINYIRTVIKKTYLKNFIETKQSRKLLIDNIKKYIDKQRYFENRIDSIIIVQKYIRKWLIFRRSKCFNRIKK